MKHYSKMKQPVPHIFVQLYSYQVWISVIFHCAEVKRETESKRAREGEWLPENAQMGRACAYIHAVGSGAKE